MNDRALPPGITLKDPRPVQLEAPYTFELPHPDHVAAMDVGDLVKAIFADEDGGYDAERMWMRIERVHPDWFAGTLESTPSDMKNLACGDPVAVPRSHVISVLAGDDRPLPTVPERRSYWDRCFVDACVVEGRCHPDYLYREVPDMTREGDKYEDSGWRIRGTNEAIAEDEGRGEPPVYVAIGAVLNADDRWLHLIDSATGTAFQWDSALQDYFELK